MQNIARLSDATLLVEWAKHEGNDHLTHLTAFLNCVGYVVFTKRNPEGRPLSKHDTRRLLKQALMAHPAYPDREHIRTAILASHYAEDMI